MNLPLDPKKWTILQSIDSTQAYASRELAVGTLASPVVLALEQTAGKGRFDRKWLSPSGDSLSLTLVLEELRDHPKPWLIGMGLACAAAAALHCRLRWPNDLYLDGNKLGGILTEIIRGVPVVGIGVNLNQAAFPAEIAETATSLARHRPGCYDAKEIARKILQGFSRQPVAWEWRELAPVWDLFDDTAGKSYRLASGETASAMGIGPQGELLASLDGEPRSVMAADAILGTTT